jgi:hypothetical protein
MQWLGWKLLPGTNLDWFPKTFRRWRRKQVLFWWLQYLLTDARIDALDRSLTQVGNLFSRWAQQTDRSSSNSNSDNSGSSGHLIFSYENSLIHIHENACFSGPFETAVWSTLCALGLNLSLVKQVKKNQLILSFGFDIVDWRVETLIKPTKLLSRRREIALLGRYSTYY